MALRGSVISRSVCASAARLRPNPSSPTTSSALKDWLDFVKQKGRMWLGAKLILGIGGLFGSQYAYVSYITYSDDQKLKRTLEYGSRPAISVKDTQFVDRPSLVKDLTRMLSPKVDEEGSSYYVISGEHGTGKTTTVKRVAQKIGGGVIYVNVPEKVEKFDEAFASETGYSFRSNSGIYDFIHILMLFGRKGMVRRVFVIQRNRCLV